MGTDIRPEITQRSPYWISKDRYYELRHFCRQYSYWKDKLDDLVKISASRLKLTTAETTHESLDSIGEFVAERAFWKERMDLVTNTANEAAGELGRYIFKAVTEGRSYENLKLMHGLPCGRDKYYDLYRKFFWLLDKARK
jgi:hypothetical protein